MRVRLYLELFLSEEAPLVSRSSADVALRSDPPQADFNRYSGFNDKFLYQWAGDESVPPWSCSTN